MTQLSPRRRRVHGLLHCEFIVSGQETNYRAAITIRTEALARGVLAARPTRTLAPRRRATRVWCA